MLTLTDTFDTAGPGNSDWLLADGPQVVDVERRWQQAISRRGKSFLEVTRLELLTSAFSRVSCR